VSEIRVLEELGVDYWSRDVASPDRKLFEARIKGQSRRVGSELQRLNGRYRCFRFSAWRYLTDLRQAITAAPFEGVEADQDFVRIPFIQEYATTLISEIRNSHRLM
jgi:hypothetical protein